MSAQAIPHWQRAGERAWRSANLEAISHLTKGLEMLQALPDITARAQQSWTCRLPSGKPSPPPRARRLRSRTHLQPGSGAVRQVGETPQLFRALWGLWYFHVVRAELQTAWQRSEELLALAQHLHDPVYLQEVHFTLGSTCSTWESSPVARAVGPEPRPLRLPAAPRTRGPFRLGPRGVWPSPGTSCPVVGYPDQALVMSSRALTLAQELSLQPRGGAGLCSHAPSVPPGAARSPRARRSRHLSVPSGVCVLSGLGDDHAGLGPQVVQDQNQEGMAQIRRG